MDSYPNEFTAHHVPLLFVAGLGSPSSPPQPSANNDPFALLQQSLAKTLAYRKSFPLWDTSRGPTAHFHTVLVDKNLRFPPLKARPAQNTPPAPAGSPATALHSPISPLTPTSPLYPDGLIAPIWIRKHRELVPSVFVLVLRLHESPPGTSLSPEDRQDEERAADVDLVREIVDRRRSTLERGIKLAVVLLCSRELLDDPALDLRLSLIRRQSGLDSRASLFVISPVPQSEVANFVQSLRQELWPAALDFYREHGRRVRRKRTRQAPPGAALSDRGWTVRYDYKLALFAEMRGEIEVSLKHYEDCYEALVDMFAQPGLLGARTKRWAEAKVLADCVSIKVSKMYLYLNEPARALAQLNRHVSRFRELSGGWQIGEDTFEFWSWLSKQYRLFGDLVAIALRAGFRLPSLRPPPTPRLPHPGSSAAANAAQIPSPGLVPLNVLQHAGHYYHLAGVCAVARRDRFREAVRAVDAAAAAAASDGVEDGAPPVVASPALAHERKVDHTEVVVELFTKAYEFFKAHKAKNMTYFVANEIASAHFEAGKFDMALKFYDRIAKSCRRDGWHDILDSILERAFRAAVRCEDWEAAIRAGFELLASSSKITPATREEYATELLDLLQSHTPAPEKARVELDMTDLAPLLDCHLAFLHPTVHAGHPVPFQLVLSAPASSRLGGLAFSRLDVHFNDGRPAVSVTHDEDAGPGTGVGHVGSAQERRARLRWAPGERRVLTGSVSVDRELDLSVDQAVLVAEVGGWTVELGLQPLQGSLAQQNVWYAGDRRVPLSHTGSSCRITRRDLRVSVTTESASPALLDERFPVHVDVANQDELEMQVSLVIFLQPGEEGSHDRILVDDLASTSVIESLPLGTLAPGASLRKTFQLETLGGIPGPRNLDVTIHAVPIPPASTPSSSDGTALLPNPTDTTLALSIPAVRPVHAAFDTHLLKRRRAVKPLLDLEEPTGWEGASDAIVVAALTAAGPWEVEVARVQLRVEDSRSVRAVASSLGYLAGDESAKPPPMSWRPGDHFNAVFSLEVQSDYGQPADSNLHLEIEWRRSDTRDARLTRTLLRLAAPRPLPLVPTVTLRLPPFLVLHEPITLLYLISNPTVRLCTLSAQLDGPSTPSTFAFAGARRLPEFVLAPHETREVRIRVVPLAAGTWTLPRLRVWRVEHAPALARVDENGYAVAPPPPRLFELEVEIESDVVEEPDAAQAELEADLRSARGGGAEDEIDAGAGGKAPLERAPVVLVLPRRG